MRITKNIQYFLDFKSYLNETTSHPQRMVMIHLPTKTKMLFIVNQVSQLCTYSIMIQGMTWRRYECKFNYLLIFFTRKGSEDEKIVSFFMD